MKKLPVTLFLMLTFTLIKAQNTTNAPSSMFGIGEIYTAEGGQFAGMGGVATAMRTDNLINTANPASLTALAGQSLVFDLGLMAAYENYSQNGAKNNSLVGNVNNIGIGFRIMPRWYGAFVFTPVSSVGYAITMTEEIAGTGTTVNSLFEGEGGLSKMGISTAYKITPHLSAGVNLSYIAGTIQQTETQNSAYELFSSFKYTLYSDFGLQYELPLHKTDHFLTFGLTYGYSQQLSQDNDLYVYTSSSDESIDESTKKIKQYMPEFIGGGVTYSSLRQILSTDYKYIKWSNTESGYATVKYQNQHLWNAGMSQVIGNPYKNPIRLMMGIEIQNSYFTIQGESSYKYYVSTGASFTRKNGVVSIGFKYKDQFRSSSVLPREQKLSAYLNVTFSERIFKVRIQ